MPAGRRDRYQPSHLTRGRCCEAAMLANSPNTFACGCSCRGVGSMRRNAERGLRRCSTIRREYNQRLNEFKATPVHDWASHAADAFRGLAVRQRQAQVRSQVQLPPRRIPQGRLELHGWVNHGDDPMLRFAIVEQPEVQYIEV